MKIKITHQHILTILAIAFHIETFAQVDVDVNLNINHRIDTITQFDRSKFVTIHADALEPEWDAGWGANFTADLRDDFLNGYDVYLGRNTGPATSAPRDALQDDNRSGYADTTSIATNGAAFRDWYGANTQFHSYEQRGDIIACAQLHPFWPDGTLNANNWALSQEDTEANPFGSASGEVMAHYLKHYYGAGGTSGQPKPKLVEIINEPMYELVDWLGVNDPIDIFKFHNTVAEKVKAMNPDVQIGGYCTAFPDFDKGNFMQWEQRWKLFMDTAGHNMDFWTIHLYDFPSFGGLEQYRKGSNMEASFDMLEQYSMLKYDRVKDIMVSEFGASVHDYQGAWSPYRDWLHMKSVNSMMMQFMERPHIINKAINFLIVKATWGTAGVDATYPHRLMRMANEPTSLSGDWVYSEHIKHYKLWENVKGKRVDSRASDPDILCDAFVDGNKAYVVINNLEFLQKNISLHLNEVGNTLPSQLTVKQLYLDDTHPMTSYNAPVLRELSYTENFPSSFTLESEATLILEYTFADAIIIDQTEIESKHYATSYFQTIAAGTAHTFTINSIPVSSYGEATLRIGVGRSHSLSLTPTLSINGTEVDIPGDFRGGTQNDRSNFFGVLEVPVPYDLIEANNTISVTFPDDGGYISTVTLQHFALSEVIHRSFPVGLPDQTPVEETNIRIYPNPASEYLLIKNMPADGMLRLYNLSGNLQLVSHLNKNTVDVRTLSTGVYIMELSTNNQRNLQKLIIQR